MAPVPHLYVHVPFCAHRCGYCDFVTVTGNEDRHGAYIDALLAEFDSERAVLGDTAQHDLHRRRHADADRPGAARPPARPGCRRRARSPSRPTPRRSTTRSPRCWCGTARASRSARRASARASSRCSSAGRRPRRCAGPSRRCARAGVANLNLDVLFGIPGETRAALDRDIDAALALEPDHLSCYELEAKPGTRFTFTHGAELARQAELLEDHYEHVIERLEGAGYRWYETANYCRDDRRCRHNLAIWRGEDYLGIGVGAVSTLGLLRRRNGPRLAPYIEALARGDAPIRVEEELTPDERLHERIMLGLRLDEPMDVAPVRDGLDLPEVERLARPRAGRRGRRYPDSHTTRPHGRQRRHLEADQRMSDDNAQPPALATPGAAAAPGRRGAHRERPAGRLEVARAGGSRRGLVVDGARRARRARGPRHARPSAHLRGPRADRGGLSPLRGRARARRRARRRRCRSTSRRRATSSTPRCAPRPRRSRA